MRIEINTKLDVFLLGLKTYDNDESILHSYLFKDDYTEQQLIALIFYVPTTNFIYYQVLKGNCTLKREEKLWLCPNKGIDDVDDEYFDDHYRDFYTKIPFTEFDEKVFKELDRIANQKDFVVKQSSLFTT